MQIPGPAQAHGTPICILMRSGRSPPLLSFEKSDSGVPGTGKVKSPCFASRKGRGEGKFGPRFGKGGGGVLTLRFARGSGGRRNEHVERVTGKREVNTSLGVSLKWPGGKGRKRGDL